MKRQVILNIALPAIALAGLAIGLAAAAHAIAQLAEIPTEDQLVGLSRKIESNELSVERLKDLSVEAARTQKEMDRKTSSLLYTWSICIAFFSVWLTIGCYRQIRIAQQTASGDWPRSAGSTST